MWERVIRIIHKRHIITVVYSVFIILNILWGGLSIVSVYAIIKTTRKILTVHLFMWVLEIICLIILIVLRYIQNKDGADKSHVAPFIIYTDFKSFDQVITKIAKTQMINKNICKGYYTFEKKHQGYLCIINYMDCYIKNDYNLVRKKTTDYARKMCGLKKRGERISIRNNIRIYINIFGEIGESIKKKTETNACYGTTYMESVVDVYLELLTGKMYIPAYVSKWYGGSRCYMYAIKYLERLFRER